MPHRLYDWRVRVKAVEREYRAGRVALDLLGTASDGDLLELAEQRGWDQLAATEIYAAERNLEATYLIRMYSVFERAVGSFWRQMPTNPATPDDGDRMLDEVGYAQLLDQGVIESAQEVRRHRNNLVHRRIEEYAEAMTVEAASRDLLAYLNRLSATWS